MEILSTLFSLGIFQVIGTVASNFLFQTLCPEWSRKKHVIISSMLPAFALWLLVLTVLTLSGELYSETFIAIIVLAIILPFIGALVGIPTSWMIMKQMSWKQVVSLTDIFK